MKKGGFKKLCHFQVLKLLHKRLSNVHGEVAVNALFDFLGNVIAAAFRLALHPVMALWALKK